MGRKDGRLAGRDESISMERSACRRSPTMNLLQQLLFTAATAAAAAIAAAAATTTAAAAAWSGQEDGDKGTLALFSGSGGKSPVYHSKMLLAG